MIKYFEVANVKPPTASRLLHQMDGRAYDPKDISNVVAKANQMCLSKRGIFTKAASAQMLVYYLMVSPDCSCVFFFVNQTQP
jgi:citrate lyase synthetase